jgi:hypothetical protein
MPSTSKKQHNFMAAVANSPAFAKKVGVPQSVGQDFTKADKGRKFSEGGDTMATKMNPGFMAMMAKKKDGAKSGAKGSMPAALAKHAAKPASKAHAGLKSGGYVKAADGVAQRGKTRAQQFCMGGTAKGKK